MAKGDTSIRWNTTQQKQKQKDQHSNDTHNSLGKYKRRYAA